ncbi:MAG: PASTA domain-containing protein, partial [Planctomycetes bacterium]|nr:PASTA domain-containing protein [Planctomycetota bacterium]
LQYDSASAPYTTTLFHTRSSGEGTDIFVKSYQRLDDPLFADRQNGGSDFRINAGGFPISSVVVRDTPFSDPYAAYALSHTPPWLTPYTGPSYDDVYADSLKGKVVTGYQGWFRTPNDLHDSGWGHWGTSSSGGTSTVDMWPNPLDYETSSLHPFPGALTESGKQGYLFSSADPAVVQKHFEWMRKYNIDGVYLQRFFTNAAAGAKPEWVLDLVREAAHLHGRVWAIEYDISGGSDANLYNTITADWMWLVDEVGITNDSRYLHEDGKPVVVVWGAGIRDGITQASMDPLIDFFKNDPVYGGNYVVGCVKNSFPSDWNSHFEMYDSIFAWMGDYQNLANFANPRGMDTQVHVWPGFSWHNLQQFVFPYQYTDRGSGSFLWGKVSNGIDIIDPDTIFVGMFDEYDEATAIMPMSDDPPVLTGEIGHYITNTNYYTSHTVPSDWWMTLSSYAKEVLCNQVPFSFTMPTEASLDNRSNIGQELSVDLGATNVSDLLVQEEPADGPTVSDVIDGVTCRRATGLYMYFDVDDATLYQVAAGQDVTIIVDYYDTSDNVTIGIHYDSVPNQWQTHPKSFTTLGTNEWQTVRFEIDDAYFGNRENGADFRLRSNTVYNMNIARVRVILAESLLEVTVPDVVGLTQAAAELDIVAAGLVVGTVTMTASPTVPAGDVISQNPAASTSVDIGSSVDIEVSLGAVPVDVPNVVGQAQATAEGNIVAVGLVVGTVTPVSSETVPFGEVISQDPIGGTSVAAGSSVDLVVSTGPEPAADRTWSNADADRVWDNPANWSGGIVPRSIDKAAIRTNAIDGPIVDSSTAALVNLVVLGDWSTVGDTIDVTGGSLTTVGWFIMSYGAANDSTFNVSGGVTTVGSHMDIGFNGAAQMNMTGGTVNVSAEFKIAANVGSTGHVQLDGGTISSGSFIMANTATMDITNGTLIVSGDVTSTVNTYIGSGWITGYDGGGTVDVDYDISNAGKTTVTASNVGNVNVPDVVGLAQATAESDIVAAGLVVGTVTTAYSGSVPAGDVISQNPTGGSSVAPGSSVDIEVSLGVEMVAVPDVVGQAQATAESNIVAAGLVVGTVTTAYSGSVPAGDVISQDPVGSTSVVIGSSVDIEVSLGLAPVNVPDVVGLAQATAEADIVAADLIVGTVTTAY